MGTSSLISWSGDISIQSELQIDNLSTDGRESLGPDTQRGLALWSDPQEGWEKMHLKVYIYIYIYIHTQ